MERCSPPNGSSSNTREAAGPMAASVGPGQAYTRFDPALHGRALQAALGARGALMAETGRRPRAAFGRW
eukprot:1836861-Rhodomonas_salina.1